MDTNTRSIPLAGMWWRSEFMATWSILTDIERSEVVSRIENGEDLTRVAIAFNLNAQSLGRKLRQLKANGKIEKYYVPVEREESHGEKSSFVEDGNEAVAEWSYSEGGPIQTLDQLIESHKIDLSIWEQHGQVVHNTWTTPRAKKGESGFEFFQNHQVKAPFVKKNLVPIFPTIRPVNINVVYRELPESRTGGIGMSYVIADPQFGFVKNLKNAKLTPFHNRFVLDLHIQMVEILQPDRIDVIGDVLDMSEWTDRFVRDPEFQWTTQPALEETSWFLAQLRRAAPNARIDVHQGNHDKRMEDAIKVHLPAAYQLKAVDELELPPALSIQRLLALHLLNINWIGDYPDDRVYINDCLSVEHGERALSPGMTARAVASGTTESVVFGHIHRQETATKTIHTRHGPVDVTACSVGCSCWTDGRVPGS